MGHWWLTIDKKGAESMRNRTIWGSLLLGWVGLASLLVPLPFQKVVVAEEPMRVGMIGLDTSHAPAFVKLINQEQVAEATTKMRVVAAFPGGSDDLAASRDRVQGFTQQIQAMGVEIVGSIQELLTKVDAVLLESVDGRKHLRQAIPVFEAGKPVFIDKPLAAGLTEAMAIDFIAKKCSGRWFSSSSLRFSPSIHRYSSPEQRAQIQGAAAWSPCALEPTHVDLFWYGIHGVEILYTAMGTGCERVVQTSTDGADLVVGVWQGGRLGSFRGIRQGASGYGLVVFGKETIESDGKYEGYQPLVEEIGRFFAGGQPPVSNEETLEMMAFMQAAYRSKQLGGQSVLLREVWDTHLAEAQDLVAKLLAD
jgi:hypothetical protein